MERGISVASSVEYDVLHSAKRERKKVDHYKEDVKELKQTEFSTRSNVRILPKRDHQGHALES